MRADDIAWADLIFAMEEAHARQLKRYDRSCQVIVLDVPDQYAFMDPELVETLRAAVEPVLAQILHEGTVLPREGRLTGH